MAGLRPLLVPSKLDDPHQKIGFVDDKWVMARAVVASPRWEKTQSTSRSLSETSVPESLSSTAGASFRAAGSKTHTGSLRTSRDSRATYVPVGDVGFWQGAFRDPAEPEFRGCREAIERRTG